MEQQNVEQKPPNKGQTLAEFAITLPILLLLLFGIVEFGRIFQSWVTLQNAARTAVRYASTGQYKEDRYDLLAMVPCPIEELDVGNSKNKVVASYDRGRGMSPIDIEIFTDSGSAESEYLYASWYGEDCYPGPDTEQNRRDILRMVSIYEEARRGAAGLLKEESRVGPSKESIASYLFSQWQRPHPDIDNLDWFDVVICSSRPKMFEDSQTFITDISTGAQAGPDDISRFQLVLDTSAFPEYAPASCVLRETPNLSAEAAGMPYNPGAPWMDPGGPGDRVTVVITFNHRLITPIGLADYITLQARRSAINESFRVTNAERALGPSGALGGAVNTPTPLPPTDVPAGTPTETFTPTATATNTDVPTDLPEPFNCDNIDVSSDQFSGNRFYMNLQNFNIEPAYLLETNIHWDKSKIAGDFPGARLASMSLANEAYWSGGNNQDVNPPTIANDEGTLFYTPGTTGHNVYIPGGGGFVNWQGQFLNAGNLIVNYFTKYDFAGTNFVFDHPDPSEPDCTIYLYLPPIPTPTDVPAGYQSPTPTYTPDCASLELRVQFVALEFAGDVTLRIINEGPRNAPFTGFNIIWPAMSNVGLKQVVFGGNNALDTAANGGSGIVIWSTNAGGGDTSPNTDSYSEPTWQGNVTVPAFSTTLLHLDFVGVSGKLPVSPSAFNGSRFDIWCGAPGTPFGPGGGGGSGGSIFLTEVNTPVPTNQPPPTWTPLAQTPTPTNTPLPAPPTNTPKPTNTKPSPTPTPSPIASFTPTPTPTLNLGGCTNPDGC